MFVGKCRIASLGETPLQFEGADPFDSESNDNDPAGNREQSGGRCS